jgi:hypothetical protein
MWEGVSQLPDYKPTFPKWHDNTVTAKMAMHLDDNGLELLSVNSMNVTDENNKYF